MDLIYAKSQTLIKRHTAYSVPDAVQLYVTFIIL